MHNGKLLTGSDNKDGINVFAAIWWTASHFFQRKADKHRKHGVVWFTCGVWKSPCHRVESGLKVTAGWRRTEGMRLWGKCGQDLLSYSQVGARFPGVLLHSRVTTASNNVLYFLKMSEERILDVFTTKKWLVFEIKILHSFEHYTM